MLKQFFSMKKGLAVLLAVFFVVSLTAVSASAWGGYGGWHRHGWDGYGGWGGLGWGLPGPGCGLSICEPAPAMVMHLSRQCTYSGNGQCTCSSNG